MKISLRWVFDHIVGDYTTFMIEDFVNRFIKTTAEIEEWKKVVIDVNALTLARVTLIDNDTVLLYSPEHSKEYRIAYRNDISVGAWYLIAFDGDAYLWATSSIFGGKKEMFLPSIAIEESLCSGEWKQTIESEDYIIEIDNKSINHRPDLWGHRGIAREVAALFDMSLIPLESLMVEKKIQTHELTIQAEKINSHTISVEALSGCDRFASLYVSNVHTKPSVLTMLIRLSRLDVRAIDFLVDSTNYVMLDLGQPMHAFDAQTISGGLTVRKAHIQEKITLLDGETVTLTEKDIVVADDKKAVSLAGIMGGAATGITSQTNSVLLESAHFDATIIRKTSMRYKKRTEASVRFEKNSDPMQNCDAIKRFLFLLDMYDVNYKTSDTIVSLGASSESIRITLTHAFIETRLGITLQINRVIAILERLAFIVEHHDQEGGLLYVVTVPSWRATKDMSIAEDVVEEIGRFIGYDFIPPMLPSIQSKPSHLQKVYRVRDIKHLLSYGFSMRELYGYAFFDELFLKQLSWEPTEYASVKNPVSELHSRLVTTLQPQLLKAISENAIHHRVLRFYEWARVWREQGNTIQEKKVLTGIMYDQDAKFDFYDGKSFITRFFSMINLQSIVWQHDANTVNTYSWFVEHKTAILRHNDHIVGVCGIVDEHILNSISSGGTAFMFEFDGDYLLNFNAEQRTFTPLPKYPLVRRDVSMLIPVSISIESLVTVIKKVDSRVESVTLIDFFEKKEWKNERSVAFHVELRDSTKTLEHDDVDQLWGKIIAALMQQGATIR